MTDLGGGIIGNERGENKGGRGLPVVGETRNALTSVQIGLGRHTGSSRRGTHPSRPLRVRVGRGVVVGRVGVEVHRHHESALLGIALARRVDRNIFQTN